MKLKDVYAEWYSYKRVYIKESSLAAYSVISANHLIPTFGDTENVTEEEIQNFILYKLQSGLSQKTVKDMLILLKMILRYAYKRGYVNSIPDFTDIKYPTNHHKSELVTLTSQEYKFVINHIKDHLGFRQLGIMVALCTGMRIGELCALKWEDFDLDSGIVKVSKTLQRSYTILPSGERSTKIVIDSPKTINSAREIPIAPDLMKILKPLFKIVNKSYYVLTNDEKYTEPRTYRSFYMEYMRSIGVRAIHFHGLRHSFATQMISAKVDVKTVSKILGHSTVAMTLDLYVHPSKEDKKAAVNQLFKSLKL